MAIKSIENAISIEPSNKWYILLYAEILFSIQDYNKTSDQYKKLIQITNNIEYYYKLAEVYSSKMISRKQYLFMILKKNQI